MSALVDIPNCLRVDELWKIGTDLTAATRSFYSYSGGPPSAGDCNAIAALFFSTVAAEQAPYMHPTRSCEGFEITDLTSSTSATGSHIAAQVGTRAGTDLPAQACFLLNLRITRRYRGGKPRMYLPYGVAEDLTSPQQWLLATANLFATTISSGVNALVVGQTVGTTTIGNQCNVSYYSGFDTVGPELGGRFRYPPKKRTVALPVDVITAWVGNPNVGTHRRRIDA